MRSQAAKAESLAVLLMLALIACIGDAKMSDWCASSAVFFGFLCTQLSFDLNEAAQSDFSRPASTALHRLYVLKEALWILTFSLLGSWPLLCGAVVFISYPALRKFTRKPLAQSVEPQTLSR